MSGSVLIVDDDVNWQIIAETLLRLRGLEVRLARDGTEACDIVRHTDVVVVILELTIPGMNGFEVLRRLRSRFVPLPVAAPPRIVVVTGRKEPEVERFVLRLGADAFLRKPVPADKLIRTVEHLARLEESAHANGAAS